MCQVRAAGRHHRAPGRQGTAPRPTPRGGGPVESRVAAYSGPRLAVASAVTRVVPARARGSAPVTPATAPGERDLAPYADASSYIEFSTARSPEPRTRSRYALRGPRGGRTGGTRRSLAPRFLARSTKCHVDTRKVPISFKYACGDAYALRIIRGATGARRWPAWGRPEGERLVPCECDLAPATYSCIDYENFEPFAGAGPDVPCRLAPPM
jgi:hypothetical protein